MNLKKSVENLLNYLFLYQKLIVSEIYRKEYEESAKKLNEEINILQEISLNSPWNLSEFDYKKLKRNFAKIFHSDHFGLKNDLIKNPEETLSKTFSAFDEVIECVKEHNNSGDTNYSYSNETASNQRQSDYTTHGFYEEEPFFTSSSSYDFSSKSQSDYTSQGFYEEEPYFDSSSFYKFFGNPQFNQAQQTNYSANPNQGQSNYTSQGFYEEEPYFDSSSFSNFNGNPQFNQAQQTNYSTQGNEGECNQTKQTSSDIDWVSQIILESTESKLIKRSDLVRMRLQFGFRTIPRSMRDSWKLYEKYIHKKDSYISLNEWIYYALERNSQLLESIEKQKEKDLSVDGIEHFYEANVNSMIQEIQNFEVKIDNVMKKLDEREKELNPKTETLFSEWKTKKKEYIEYYNYLVKTYNINRLNYDNIDFNDLNRKMNKISKILEKKYADENKIASKIHKNTIFTDSICISLFIELICYTGLQNNVKKRLSKYTQNPQHYKNVIKKEIIKKYEKIKNRINLENFKLIKLSNTVEELIAFFDDMSKKLESNYYYKSFNKKM